MILTLAPGIGKPVEFVTLPTMSAWAMPAAQRVSTPASAADRRARRERAEVRVMSIPSVSVTAGRRRQPTPRAKILSAAAEPVKPDETAR